MKEFYEDISSRKQLARATKYVKNGSKSKMCSLPSDKLTESQRKKMNGKVTSMNINEPMRYTEFAYLSRYLKQEYIDHLFKLFNPDWKSLATMFNVSTAKLKRDFEKEEITFVPKRGRMERKNVELFHEFLHGKAEGVHTSPGVFAHLEQNILSTAKEFNTAHSPKPHGMNLANFSIRYNGQICAVEIAERLEQMIGGCTGELTIKFREG